MGTMKGWKWWWLAVAMGCQTSPQAVLTFSGDTKVLEQPRPERYAQAPRNRVVGVVEAGTRLPVVGVMTGKDYRGYKVKLDERTEGWVIHGGAFSVAGAEK